MSAQKRGEERRGAPPSVGEGICTRPSLGRLPEREQATSFAPTHGDTLHTKVEILPNAISYLNKNLL